LLLFLNRKFQISAKVKLMHDGQKIKHAQGAQIKRG